MSGSAGPRSKQGAMPSFDYDHVPRARDDEWIQAQLDAKKEAKEAREAREAGEAKEANVGTAGSAQKPAESGSKPKKSKKSKNNKCVTL